MSKHSPGPWNAHTYPDVKTWTVASARTIANRIEKEADARLIAAAPRMALVLEKLREVSGPPELALKALAALQMAAAEVLLEAGVIDEKDL